MPSQHLCIQLAQDNSKVVIMPNPAFIPKKPSMGYVPVELEASNLLHSRLVSSGNYIKLCPVGALNIYMDTT